MPKNLYMFFLRVKILPAYHIPLDFAAYRFGQFRHKVNYARVRLMLPTMPSSQAAKTSAKIAANVTGFFILVYSLILYLKTPNCTNSAISILP